MGALTLVPLLLFPFVSAAGDDAVHFPSGVHDGHVCMAVTGAGEKIRVLVPQGYGSLGPGEDTSSLITTRNLGVVLPKPTPQEQYSMQVHLHLTGNYGEVAVSWATPTSLGCLPAVQLDDDRTGAGGKIKQSGVTRSYSNATLLLAGSPHASFQHVVLSGLEEGREYGYTVRCDGFRAYSGAFRAPITAIPKNGSASSYYPYTFAVFGDMSVSYAAHDTMNSLLASNPPVESVFHVGDLAYAATSGWSTDDNLWSQFFGMIEPLAARVPWTVLPGNHDMLPHDSGMECGLPMLSRFETPRSRAAQPHLLSLSPSERCLTVFNNSVGNPYWYAVNYGLARVVTYSTDSNLTKGSPQWEYLEEELARADLPSSRATHPWLLLMGHKPMYTASTGLGEIGTRGDPDGIDCDLPPAEQPFGCEGTEGMLTAELEEMFVRYHVDVSFYGHVHSYNRMYPVKDNGTTVERPAQSNVYRNPQMPVHMMVGMGGAPHIPQPFATPDWSAYAEKSYGWMRATFTNRSALYLEFISNGDGYNGTSGYAPAVHDEVWIIKERNV